MTYGIVICSYRYGHLAAHAIESILSQTKKFDKIWFVDDAVGDCSHLPKLYPSINYVLRERNLGTVDNFNEMLQMVDTDYVMFLGADNWLRSDALELLSNRVQAHTPDIVVYDIVVTGELKSEIYRIYGPSMYDSHGDLYWNRMGGHHGSMLYNVKLAKSVGGYAHNRSSNRTDEDEYLWNRMRSAGGRVNHLNQGLLYYRRHKENFNKY